MSLTGLRLRYYTDDEIRSLAVVKVLNASTYDRGVPKIDGVNDARLGLSDHTIRCPTCYKSNCNQHYGFIELSRPVFRLGSINIVIMILRSFCRECAMPKFTQDQLNVIQGGLKERLKQISELCRNKFICQHCGAPQPVYSKRDRTFIDAVYRPRDLSNDFVKDRGPEYLEFLKCRFMPDDAASILYALKDSALLNSPETLMCKLQIVPPPIIRPSNFAGQTRVRSENDMTVALQDIVRVNNELDKLTPGTKAFIEAYDKLQIVVSGLTNHAIKRSAAQKGILPVIAAISKRKVIDLRARLNGKKARIRGNLSGKRVDQSGRTVITGDSSHDIDQLGLPSCMMNKLTFPETVNATNMTHLQKSVIIGAYQNDGALAVRPPSHDHDRVIWLPILDINSRRDLASQLRIGWTVERHLVNDDAVLFNRQPSLWKASMMCFRIYRVDGLTARLPLPVTRAFNADFDGDEMNVHALQSHEAIAEARELMKVDKQIITPQSGTVIIGLVQDSLVGSWRLTSRDCFFTREQAIALMSKINYEVSGRSCSAAEYSSASKAKQFAVTELPTPAILKPQLWTGKQLVSLLLPTNISIEKKGSAALMAPNDDVVVVRDGSLIMGRLSKAHLGASNTGIIQAIWRLYGPGGTHKFISDAQRVFVAHLDRDGPSQSIKDCLISTGVTHTTCINILSKQLKRADQVLKLDLHEGLKEAKSNTILQETLRSVGATVLSAIRKDCALSDCVNSGSKGNVMNIAQIGGCVGQQNIYGRRIPIRSTNLGPRTLIYYAPGDLRPEARGFVANSYISGLSPAEFFEHQMAGREGIVATAVNTSETGYNQRRMIKGQESQCISYDGTVRVSNNCIIQCFYGGDDLDGSRLERIQLPWLPNAEDYLGPQPECVMRCITFAKKYASWNANFYKDLDLHFPCAVSIQSLIPSIDTVSESLNIEDFMKKLMGLHATHHAAKRSMLTISAACTILQIAGLKRPLSASTGTFILKKYAQALVNPGEGVGALGASSIGEPSMQKTLNTFHYTGIADKNVTITGLPRFKQLINGVDTCETANVTAKVRSFEQCSEALQISNVMLYDIMNSSDITTSKTQWPIFTQFRSRGPFAAKFAKVPNGIYEIITLKLQWTLCARKNITIDAVARSLRTTFSYDAFIMKKPHWSEPVITILLAPWITGSDAIAAGLYAQQQIRGIDYIKNAIVLQEKRFNECVAESQHAVETEGSNMVHIAACPFIVPETIRSTNVSEVCTILGISAGVSILQSELHKVLSFDGTYVDARHSWLLADTMARCGSLAAMNRHHMEDLGSSFLQEASFERSLEVFEEGAAFGRSDPVAGSTERIIVGQPVSIGTGIVGIIAEKFDSSEQILVAPMHEDHTATEIVGPLRRPIDDYNTDAWSKNVFEMSKISMDSFNEESFTLFRSIAASRRTIPKIEFKFKLTESQYKNILKSCYTYTWTISEPSHFITKVHWTHNDKIGLTILKNHKTHSVTHEIVNKSTSNNKELKIYIETILDPQDVPFGVESLYTEMHHLNYFNKSNFYIQLSKEWTGSTNVEAEEKLLKTKGLAFATIGIVDSEEILRSRCTDAQLGNAIYERLSI